MPRRLYLTSATGALSTAHAPVGGGVAVLEALLPYLAARLDYDVTVLRPGPTAAAITRDGVRYLDLPVAAIQDRAPDHLLRLGAQGYARFALQWERQLGRFFRTVDPHGAVVIANDVSEGPPFARLADRGLQQLVLYHVVVADFFARRYLNGQYGVHLSPATAARCWRALEHLHLTSFAPAIARLVWEKEAASARDAQRCVVPSPQLADALVTCYPDSGVRARTAVIPWGVIGPADPARRGWRAATLALYHVTPDHFVIGTLSRLSPEKGIERILQALHLLERDSPQIADRLALIVAGAPAYMGGRRYERQLHAQAARLRRVLVRFPGYLPPERKWNLLAAADLFCSPSTYEAYGLGIAQALASGTPVLATDHQGARATVTTETGWIVPPTPAALADAIRIAVAEDRKPRRQAAAAWGAAHPFADAAARILALIDALPA